MDKVPLVLGVEKSREVSALNLIIIMLDIQKYISIIKNNSS